LAMWGPFDELSVFHADTGEESTTALATKSRSGHRRHCSCTGGLVRRRLGWLGGLVLRWFAGFGARLGELTSVARIDGGRRLGGRSARRR
jgi:hypothetical protein